MHRNTVAILLDRLAELPRSHHSENALHLLLRDYRRERETGGPMSDAQWRGILLCARDLVGPGGGLAGHPDVVAIERALEREIATSG